MTPRPFAPNETLTLEEAVKLYTVNAAFNGFDDSELGNLSGGYRADVVLLDSIVEGMHPALLRKVRVATSIVRGMVVYSSDGGPWLSTS
jgi:predicted amidohydrolase YtcJ